ncbi:NADPH-dependent F420 reductase [Actinokineospora auranticolor]|uniref:Pyrroline-5-carboxylate reductase catalytic N-terminal domain-containing protein n=1 Tax=Actinokineospora auranticolor TaxID=155976 RepID=A0A2S6GJL6_9PSEU|nr:NADPH-dependent F420 reductase [Actinokineospora auranticolor]PPK65428.1 hypothetical protein CLV40_11480 [Actinokineospora auranticolor]
MRIGILGSGDIGGTVAGLLVRAGHEVAVANSRGPHTLAGLVAGLGPRGNAATIESAIAYGDVVVLAIPFGRYRDLPADLFTGKIVVDTMNYDRPRDGRIAELDSGETTSSELLAAHLPGARVVKSINTLYYRVLAAPPEDRLALFVAGDDPEAKRVVSDLVSDIGFAPLDTGSLAEGGRRQQPGTAVFNVALRPADVPYSR